MARKRRKKDSENKGGAGWMASFADTMTLLMTFFILLYSMASVEEEKMIAMANALQNVLQGKKSDAIFDYNLSNGEATIISADEKELEQNESDYTYEELKKYIEGNNLETLMTVEKNEEGVELQLSDSILFPSGTADLLNESKTILNKVAELILNSKTDIVIAGHTDNRPIKNNKFPSNWELSVQRAVNVVKYFTEGKGITSSRFSVMGYGEHRPIGDNSTEEGQRANRRVSILFKNVDNN
ncbi:OmpA/MotB family protein [Clostridium massiliamazoniense]|uniref:OmpA/MotB family protein n=1 Tax=Clostridium massiliamazoniense TaxID=1347366 RepID=UPI0006D82147|nr:flagellar motor protein MotB [Clostridium massiliamazoniense]